MFVKIVGALLLIGFLYVQLGSSLDCRSCDTPASCKSPSTVTCDSKFANLTTAHLHTYFRENLTSLASNRFECFYHNYTARALNVTYRGCIYGQIQPCSLTLKNEYQLLRQVSCTKCAGNLCNPAGTLSSSLTTIIASIVAIGTYKVLKM